MNTKSIGALWQKTAQGDGKEYMSGTLDLGALGTLNIVVFTNDNKKKEGQPDYRIYLSRPQQAESADSPEGQPKGTPF